MNSSSNNIESIKGSKIKIAGQKETPDTGFMNLTGKESGAYYLINEINVLNTKYQIEKIIKYPSRYSSQSLQINEFRFY